jgi:hypothetical protein
VGSALVDSYHQWTDSDWHFVRIGDCSGHFPFFYNAIYSYFDRKIIVNLIGEKGRVCHQNKATGLVNFFMVLMSLSISIALSRLLN